MVQPACSRLDDDSAPALRWNQGHAVLAGGNASVAARQDERHRLGRDLYDRIGPALGAVGARINLVRSLVESDPDTAAAMLGQLRTDLQIAVADVRRLVWALGAPSEPD